MKEDGDYSGEGDDFVGLWRYFSFVLLAVVLPNAPLSAVSSYFELFRPLVNFDYIIAVLLVVVGFRLFGIVLLLVFMASDIFHWSRKSSPLSTRCQI